MKKFLIYFLLLLFIVASFVLACLIFSKQKEEGSIFWTSPEEAAVEQAQDEAARLLEAVEDQLFEMSLAEKVGQLFVFGFAGKKFSPELQTLITDYQPGGLILLAYNLGSPEEIKNLISEMQAASSSLPLFVSIDQEGGVVSRLKNINMVAQSEIKSVEEARQIAQERGQQLVDLGFNVNYAPVLDYISQSSSFLAERVFSGTMEERSALGKSMVEAYQSVEIIPVIKHFPGHPDSKIDSHQALPTADLSKATVLNNAQSFKIALNAGPMMVMSGHVFYPQVDAKYPASLSSIFIKDILRGEWGYDGVVITDDLSMGALKNTYTDSEIARLAFAAGNDILLYIGNLEQSKLIYQSLLADFQSGLLLEEDLNQAVKRILILKHKIFNLYD
jgi:beta-N-acetylhexosaminidase